MSVRFEVAYPKSIICTRILKGIACNTKAYNFILFLA